MSEGFLSQKTVSALLFMINNLDKPESKEQTSWHRALGPWDAGRAPLVVKAPSALASAYLHCSERETSAFMPLLFA